LRKKNGSSIKGKERNHPRKKCPDREKDKGIERPCPREKKGFLKCGNTDWGRGVKVGGPRLRKMNDGRREANLDNYQKKNTNLVSQTKKTPAL